MRRYTLLVLALLVGVAIGRVTAVDRRARPAGAEVVIDVPHPTDPYGRVRAPLALHRVTDTDGTAHDVGPPPEGREWVVTVNGTTYRGSAAPR